MSKVYFDSDKECGDFFDKTVPILNGNSHEKKRAFVFNCNRLGFIKKSDLEIAREEYNKEVTLCEEYSSDRRIINYIKQLEKALEKALEDKSE